ncbi:MAG TPA: SpoIIE family protein phosphatase [Candidatus Sulfotelmatobacter sp.]|jgi:serine phosphatase RsbU (regulator of sigma subunit)|nr:SpoIIE family protein phosphatase [Candidatus Sulfotelmatobacter sp.]
MTTKVLKGLVYKQARTVVIIAVLVGFASAAIEMAGDLRSERQNLVTTTRQILSMINVSAADAAFQMNQELSRDLVDGLFHSELVRSAALLDNFGNEMARKERPASQNSVSWIAEKLFEDSTEFSLPLVHRTPRGIDEIVGELQVTLDPVTVAGGFFNRVGLSLAATVARVVSICLLIVIAFNLTITRPLLRIIAAVRKVDPAQPGHRLVENPKGHDGDELGVLVGTMNRLLTAFQTGLEARDKAQADLTELARTLEQRVAERTLELAREKEGVERALTQLNEAHAELNKVNRHINESIRYASRIQSSLLPDSAALDGILSDIAVGWAPRDVVGGDFYWIGRFGNRCLIAVMDCTGHGVPGAFMTAIVASVLDRILHEHCHDDPAMILQLLNRLVKSSLRQDHHDVVVDLASSDDGLDAAICLIDTDRDTLTYAGANIPLIYAQGQELREIKGDRHSLGYRTSLSDFAFTNHILPIERGQSFYLATDGVTDQVGGPTRRLFGRRRLLQALESGRDLPMRKQMERVFMILADYRGDEPRRDDLTFVGFTPLAAVGGEAEEPTLVALQA